MTTQIGRITPIFCELVPNKGSIRINPRFGLQLMPMVFPVQTPMRARIAFFKYPLRALWKGYRDFVGNFRQGLEEPYIDFNTESALKNMASTGSLGDYLGLPTTLFGVYGAAKEISGLQNFSQTVAGNKFGGSSDFTYLSGLPISDASKLAQWTANGVKSVPFKTWEFKLSDPATASSSTNEQFVYQTLVSNYSLDDAPLTSNSRIRFDISWNLVVAPTQAQLDAVWQNISCFVSNHSAPIWEKATILSATWQSDLKVIRLIVSFPESLVAAAPSAINITFYYNVVNAIGRRIAGNDTAWDIQPTTLGQLLFSSIPVGVTENAVSLGSSVLAMSKFKMYYYQTEDKPIDLSLATSPYYNSTSDNKDNQIKVSAYAFRAYEGIYNAYYRDNRNNPYYINGEVQYNQWIPSYEGGADQNNYVLHYANWEKDFLTTAVQSPQQGTAPLVGITTYTETVSDEETGVTSEVSRVALGSQAGVAGVRGDSNNAIECFCDEESIVMGVLIVTPMPVYTQLLPKHFTYRGLLDHYQPEFNHIGFQPILYKEVCPIQAYNENPKSLGETFGYNRPWYEYVQKYDVAHGLFRTDLSNFLMHRVFNEKPQLAQSFLLIDPEQVTDVFSVTETTDKVYGQIYFDCTAKLPISRVAIPRLD